MSYADTQLGYKITTAEEATKVVMEAVQKVEEARRALNILVPEAGTSLAAKQQKDYHRMLMWHGHAFGALVMAHRVGLLSDEAYEKLRQRITQTMVPTTVGEIVRTVPRRRT